MKLIIAILKGWKENTVNEPRIKGDKYKIRKRLLKNFSFIILSMKEIFFQFPTFYKNLFSFCDHILKDELIHVSKVY